MDMHFVAQNIAYNFFSRKAAKHTWKMMIAYDLNNLGVHVFLPSLRETFLVHRLGIRLRQIKWFRKAF